jgi:hypothetical protein
MPARAVRLKLTSLPIVYYWRVVRSRSNRAGKLSLTSSAKYVERSTMLRKLGL